jgi:hypothetical protein
MKCTKVAWCEQLVLRWPAWCLESPLVLVGLPTPPSNIPVAAAEVCVQFKLHSCPSKLDKVSTNKNNILLSNDITFILT